MAAEEQKNQAAETSTEELQAPEGQETETTEAATQNRGTTADAVAGDATTPAPPADVDVVAEADVIAAGPKDADPEELAQAEAEAQPVNADGAADEATPQAQAEETTAPEKEGLLDRARHAVEDAAEAVADVVEDLVDRVTGREDLPEEPTSVADPENVEPPAGKLGFTGEVQGRVIKLEDLLTRGDGEDGGLDEGMMSMYEQTFAEVTENEIVKGRVVRVGEKDVVVDIGFKSDGIVSKNEFDRELKPGDEVEVYIERLEDRHGQLVLSKRRAEDLRRWQNIENAFEEESVVEGEIIRRIKGGMIVELYGKEAFLPGSQVDVRPVRDFDTYIGKRMEFKVVKINPSNGNVVVSHKALIEKDLEEQRRKILGQMEVGQILEGTVKNVTDFGVFLDLGGVDGLLHITDLSWGRVQHPSEVVSLDQKLNVVVLDYDKDRQRISLGLKQLLPHPWEGIEERYAKSQVVEGKVVSITDYGAFVELEKGIEGLVHISEMSWTEHVKHPTQKVSLGQKVEVKILNIDTDEKKISLGMKQLEPDPWENVLDKYPPGTVTKGIVRNLTNFGAFVELEPGIDGLVHVSDLSWTKKVRNPSEVVRKGQDLDVVVLDVDATNRRMSLGHKQVETNPWNQFAKAYAVDTDVEATIQRFSEDGAVVDLPLDVEGFVPASQLDKSGNMQAAYQVGDTLQLRVIRFDPENKEIVLSERARKRAEERAVQDAERREQEQQRRRERKEVETFVARENSGPATIGELSGLGALKAKMEAQERQAAKDRAELDRSANAAEAEESAERGDVTPEGAAIDAEKSPDMETRPSAPQQEIHTKDTVEGGEQPEQEKAAIKGVGDLTDAETAPDAVTEAAADKGEFHPADTVPGFETPEHMEPHEAKVPDELQQPADEAVEDLKQEDEDKAENKG